MNVETITSDLLTKLIAFDTTSAKSNLALIDFVSVYLADHGVDSTLVHNAESTKANLYATIGPPDTSGVVLSGHTDVVPVTGQDWTSDPFALELRGQRWFGRGSADMKGFIASTLAAVPAMLEQPLLTPLHLAFSFDEEVGCLGVRHLLDFIERAPIKPLLAIIGEPTLMAPVIGHKGKTAFRVKVSGLAGHSAYTSEGVNAIEYAARLITFINSLHRQKSAIGPFDAHYRVPHTTLHVGTIVGGTALNIIPSDCEFVFEVRALGNDDSDELLSQIRQEASSLQDQMQEIDENCTITLQQTVQYPGLDTAEDASAVAFIRQLLQSNQPIQKVSFGTEGGLFQQQLNIPAVVCGPGSIEQAHKPDEFIAASELELCDQFLGRLIEHCRREKLQ